MKKSILLLFTAISSIALGQNIEIDSYPSYSYNNVVILGHHLNVVTEQQMNTLRVLTEEERDNLVNDIDFQKKCQWAIRDYASFWIGHDGSGLSTDDRFKWRREYALIKTVWNANYVDPLLSARFIILAKGMQFNIAATPTVEEIIAQFVATGAFESLASQYFDMLTK